MVMRHEHKSQLVRNFPDCFYSRGTGSEPFNPGGNSEWVPPDPFSNSEVKTLSADGSLGPFASLRVRPLGCTLAAFARSKAVLNPKCRQF